MKSSECATLGLGLLDHRSRYIYICKHSVIKKFYLLLPHYHFRLISCALWTDEENMVLLLFKSLFNLTVSHFFQHVYVM